ncbi:hypothetical protein JW813_06770 [Clostridium botulinum]|uniref:hypothetical protein n=1 Tax=Clostridium botulinum TaxID=1491 RepID=UPI002247F0D2|nr:hypothetical protein [Clostridium botulinum]UZP04707.1 hypothetical protein JW813_06770 [Clostridium botulinum]UZP08119.1 hypothetical protein JYA71_07045 [Clostridium botulinum]UZP11446.1 hypothetical protein JYA74_06765 [Clostridium botulinum]
MKLKLEGCSNAGFSLTDVRKEQILELAEWIEKHREDSKKTYKQIQNEIEQEGGHLDSSKVRMLVPFLRKMGYVNNEGFEQKNSLIYLKDFFTDEGICFVEYLKMVSKITLLDKNEIEDKIKEVNGLFNIINMINLVNNGEEIYIDTIEFLKKYRTMDKNEFFLMTTLKKKHEGEYYIKMLDKAICKYRDGAFRRIEIIKHQNAYNYVKSFLIETNLIIQLENSIRLNDKYFK